MLSKKKPDYIRAWFLNIKNPDLKNDWQSQKAVDQLVTNKSFINRPVNKVLKP